MKILAILMTLCCLNSYAVTKTEVQTIEDTLNKMAKSLTVKCEFFRDGYASCEVKRKHGTLKDYAFEFAKCYTTIDKINKEYNSYIVMSEALL